MKTHMKTNIKHAFMAIAVISIGLGSCKKDKNSYDNAADSEAVIENSAADAAFSDVAGIADEAYTGSLTSYRTAGNERITTTCATITFDTTSTPKQFTIDFGTTNCLCKDKNYRRGAIIVAFTGHYRDSASYHSITFSNYFVNDNQLLGTKTVTNNGRNLAGNLSYSVTINGSINWSTGYSGGTSTFNSTHTREWIQGENTFIWSDDVYLITGTASGITRSGNSYTLATQTPLRKEIGFRHFTSGILEWTPQGKSTRTIDYGYVNGNRDNLARVTVDGNTFTVQLK